MKKTSTGLWSHIRMTTTFALGESPSDLETNIGPSETVPDQALSLSELLLRQARGLPVHTKNPVYSDEYLPDLSKMDLAEIQELKEHARTEVDSLRHKLQQAQLAEREAVIAEKKAQLQAKGQNSSQSQQNPPAQPAAAENGAQ
ncbi:hypothetical protein [Tortoise microvirus 86]|nr:hypothetical protein [Tortoise microvirus 86]